MKPTDSFRIDAPFSQANAHRIPFTYILWSNATPNGLVCLIRRTNRQSNRPSFLLYSGHIVSQSRYGFMQPEMRFKMNVSANLRMHSESSVRCQIKIYYLVCVSSLRDRDRILNA